MSRKRKTEDAVLVQLRDQVAHLDGRAERWWQRLSRAMTTLQALRRQRRRLMRRIERRQDEIEQEQLARVTRPKCVSAPPPELEDSPNE